MPPPMPRSERGCPAVLFLIKLLQPEQIEAKAVEHGACQLTARGSGFQIQKGCAHEHIVDWSGGAGQEWQKEHIAVGTADRSLLSDQGVDVKSLVQLLLVEVADQKIDAVAAGIAFHIVIPLPRNRRGADG